MQKADMLTRLARELEENAELPLRESNLVFGEGNAHAKVMFIGEAPGFHENEARRPFVGRAGKLLNKLIEEIGWKREDVYITNIVKRRPPENRDPSPDEIAAYSPYLARQIEIIDPLVIVTLGRFSMNYFVPTLKITKDQGKVFRLGKRFLYPVFHPAAALRSPDMMEEFRKSIKKLPAVVKKCESLLKEDAVS
ncbi:MAG: uracil-DNA glycosylase [bacterium]|nr:uracil-DNA glycosylase [bacterium]